MRQCSICGKGSIIRGTRKKLRGNYNPTSKKRKYPNLQFTRLADGLPAQAGLSAQAGKRVLACVKCIKTAAKKI